MNQYEEDNPIVFVFEKDINLYDANEAGRTCQKILINGIEIGIHDFKRSKEKQRKEIGHNWPRKHGFIPSD